MKLSSAFGRLAIVACAFAVVAVAASEPAQAATASNAKQQVVKTVMTSKNPVATYTSLSPSQRLLFRQSQQQDVVGVTTATYGGRFGTIQATAPVGGDLVKPDANGCWYRYWYTTWSDLGYLEGATWMQLNWCGRSGSITSHSLGTHGGKVLGLGFKYEGIDGTGGLNAGWEYREYVEFKFEFGIKGIGLEATPCMEIRGGATGLYSESKSCDLG